MNKKLLIGIGVAVVLLLVGGYWYMTSQSSSSIPATSETAPTTSVQQTQVTTAPEASGSGTFVGSLTDLMTRGGAYTCTWTFDVDGNAQKGTVYISDDKMAGQIDIDAGSTTMTMNMVGDGETMKGWMTVPSVNQKIGFQFDTKKFTSNGGEIAGVDPNTAAQFKEKYNYQCAPWVPDPSKFVVPTDVKFMQSGQ